MSLVQAVPTRRVPQRRLHVQADATGPAGLRHSTAICPLPSHTVLNIALPPLSLSSLPQLFGRPSLDPEDERALRLKKGKPEPRACHVCGAKVVSTASLKYHMKQKHPGHEPEATAAAVS